MTRKCLGEDMSKLEFCGNMWKGHNTSFKGFMNKVTTHFNIFYVLMIRRIGHDLNSTHIISMIRGVTMHLKTKKICERPEIFHMKGL